MKNACFIQEAGRASQSIRFEARYVVVAEASPQGAREYTLGYLDIDLDSASPTAPRSRLKAALAVVTGGSRAPHARIPLFVRRPGRETLDIWRGRHAETIVAELTVRWRDARLRAAVVDVSADPRREIARFQTLLARGIVTAQDGATALARIAERAGRVQLGARP